MLVPGILEARFPHTEIFTSSKSLLIRETIIIQYNNAMLCENGKYTVSTIEYIPKFTIIISLKNENSVK